MATGRAAVVLAIGRGVVVSPVMTNLAAWFKYGVGITSSQWDDASGNARHMTLFNSPTIQPGGAVLFNGTTQYGKTAPFTLNQPTTVYVLFKQVTWTSGGTVFDGNASNSGRLFQSQTTPNLGVFGNVSFTDGPLALGTYGVACVVFNGALTLLQINNGAPVSHPTSQIFTNNMGGFTLAARAAAGGASFGNIEAKGALIYSAANDAPTRALNIAYLNGTVVPAGNAAARGAGGTADPRSP